MILLQLVGAVGGILKATSNLDFDLLGLLAAATPNAT